jgi:hypothetical protein
MKTKIAKYGKPANKVGFSWFIFLNNCVIQTEVI